MNTFYNSMFSEYMTIEKMKDIQREVEMINLLNEAGLSKPGLFERAAVAFGSTLIRLGQRRQQKHLHLHATNGKYAMDHAA